MSWQANGYRAWFLQRLSALYILVCLLFIVGFIFLNTIDSYSEWTYLFYSPITNILILLFFIAIMVHGWVGIRDVIIDYVHHAIARIVMLNLVMIFLISMTIWISYILITLVKL